MTAKRMLKLHPEILSKDGKKQFVVLPYEEFLAVQERLADADDLLELRKAKRAEGGKKSIPLAVGKRELGLTWFAGWAVAPQILFTSGIPAILSLLRFPLQQMPSHGNVILRSSGSLKQPPKHNLIWLKKTI